MHFNLKFCQTAIHTSRRTLTDTIIPGKFRQQMNPTSPSSLISLTLMWFLKVLEDVIKCDSFLAEEQNSKVKPRLKQPNSLLQFKQSPNRLQALKNFNKLKTLQISFQRQLILWAPLPLQTWLFQVLYNNFGVL